MNHYVGVNVHIYIAPHITVIISLVAPAKPDLRGDSWS